MRLAFRMAAVTACHTRPGGLPDRAAAGAGCRRTADAAAAVNLTAAEIKATFVGNTQQGESINGVFLIYMAPNGVIRGKFDLGQDHGTWRITDDGKLCAKWRGLFRSSKAAARCRRKAPST